MNRTKRAEERGATRIRNMKIRVAGLIPESIVDGRGIRYVVFTQGCPHNCKGCHNPDSHSVSGGKLADTDEIFEEFKENPILKGITFSGGEPFLQPEPLVELAKKVHEVKKDITCYSGYTFEELMEMKNPAVKELLENVDVLIDGRYIEEEKNLELLFRGSENQRVIDSKASIKLGKAVLVENNDN